MAIGLKKALKLIGGLVTILVLYGTAVAGYLWKFESPHDPLPVGFLDHYEEYVSPDAMPEIASVANSAMTSLASDLQTVSISGAIAGLITLKAYSCLILAMVRIFIWSSIMK